MNITIYHHSSGVIIHIHTHTPETSASFGHYYPNLPLPTIIPVRTPQAWVPLARLKTCPATPAPTAEKTGHLGMPVAGDPGTGHGFSAGLNTHGFSRSCQRNEIREAVQSPGLGFDRRRSKNHVPIHHLWWVHQIRRASRPCGK